MDELSKQVAELLQKHGQSRDASLFESVLRLVLAHFKSETGTIHLLDADKQQLHLAAQVGLPPQVQAVVTLIPVGKGIAGQTVAQGKPVTVCNIQTDKSGVAKAGAKQTGVGGALCVPMWNDGKITGTLGIGTAREYEYTLEETRVLEDIGRLLGSHLSV